MEEVEVQERKEAGCEFLPDLWQIRDYRQMTRADK